MTLGNPEEHALTFGNPPDTDCQSIVKSDLRGNL